MITGKIRLTLTNDMCPIAVFRTRKIAEISGRAADVYSKERLPLL